MNRDSRLLLIEDNAVDALIARRRLSPHWPLEGITSVETIGDALAHLRVSRPDVIILDLHLPDAQGLESLERIRAADATVPLIVLTGTADDATARAAIRLGARDYLVKSDVTEEILLGAISSALEPRNEPTDPT